MAKAKKALAATPEETAKIQSEITMLTAFKQQFEFQKADWEKRFPATKDAEGNIIKRGPTRKIEMFTEKIDQINARLAELQSLLTA